MLSHELNPLCIYAMYLVGPSVNRNLAYFIAYRYVQSSLGFTTGRIVRIGLFSHTLNE